jgi:hypothetical protein
VSIASSDRRPLLAAIALFVVALAIRLFGIGWGLPNDLHNDSLHPDERVVYFNYSYPANASAFVPGNYNYPSFYPIVLRVAGDMASTYGDLDTPDSLPDTVTFREYQAGRVKLAAHQRVTNIVGRILNCLAGAATAAVIFFLLLRFSGMVGALSGGLLAAVAPAFVVHSRFQTVDVFATFFMWLSILYAIKLYLNAEGGSLDNRYAILAGVFAGLSTGTKYTGVVALLSVFTALALTRRTGWMRTLLIASAVCIGIFVVTTPGVFLDSSQFLASVQLEQAHMRVGHDIAFVHSPPGMIYQLGNLFTGIGPLAFVVGMIGLLYGAIKTRTWMWVVLPAVVAYFLIVGTSEVKFVRYGLPLIPAICLGFGYAINGAIQRPKWRLMGGIVGAISLLGLESLALSAYKPMPYWACFDPRFGGIVGTIRYTQDMMKEDPRDEAARFVFNVAKSEPNSTVGIFRAPWYWTVPVIKDAILLYNQPTEVNQEFARTYFETTKDPHVERVRDLPGARYIVLSSLETSPFDRIQNAKDVPDVWRRRYEDLRSTLTDIRTNYDVVATFGGDAPVVEDLMHVQPKAYVLKHK